MIDTQNTEDLPRRDHSLKSGDTPALGLPYVPGSGGKRRRMHTLGIDVEATAEITVGDDVLWHDREATVVEVYPAGQPWLRVLCKIEFEDGGPFVVAGRDELQLVTAEDARYFVSLADVTLEDTAPLPSPVPRLAKASLWPVSVEVAASSLEETATLPRTGDVELDDDGQAALADPSVEESPSVTLPALPAVGDPARPGAFAGVWLGLLDVLRLIGAFLAWPFRRDGGRKLGGWIVDQVADGVEAAADWERLHARLIAKIVLGALSVSVLGGAGVAWLLTAVPR